MSEERKPVVCPWCGWDMVAREAQDIFHGKYNVYVCEACEAVSPIAYSDKAAYAAATATPPNLPLTREQVEAMDEWDAVWETYGHEISGVAPAKTYRYDLDAYHLFATVMLFARKPTPDDISAARAGKGEGNAD